MRRAWFKTLWKKSIKQLPAALVGSLLLLLFITLFIRLVSTDDATTVSKEVYVYIEDEDQMVKTMLSAINQMESIGTYVEFIFIGGDDPEPEGDPVGEIYIPSDFYQHIIDGTNEPARIIVHGGDSLQSRIFYGLAKSGSQMLGRTQAALYAGYSYAREADQRDLVPQIEEELNARYISYVLGRSAYFHSEDVETFGVLNSRSHLISSLVIWFIAMVTIFYQYLFTKETKYLERLLTVKGVGVRWTAIYQWLILCIHLMLLTIPLFVLFQVVSSVSIVNVRFILTLLVVIGGISLFHSLLYRLSKEASIGAIWIFFATTAGLLLSGALLPLAYLPTKLQQLANYLPWRGWHQLLGEGLSGGGQIISVNVLAFLVIFVVLHEVINHGERREMS